MSRWLITRLDKFDQFSEYVGEWDNWLAQAGITNIFLTHAWLSEWWRAFGANYELWTLIVRDAERVIGVAPLMLGRVRGERRLMFMGAARVSPNHLDLIVALELGNDFVHALVAYLFEQRAAWDVLDLDRLAAESPTRGFLLDALRARAPFTSNHVTERCPYATLPATYEEYVNSRGKSTRKNLRSHARELSRDFPSAKHRCAQTPDQVEEMFAAFVQMQRARWANRAEEATWAQEDFVAFHRAVAQRALARGELLLDALYVDHEIVAVSYAYRAGNRIMDYSGGFDERWAKYSPGTLLLAHAIEEAIVAGAHEYDFLQGQEDYKNYWATGIRNNYCVRAASPTWRGRALWLRRVVPRSIKRNAKRVWERMRPNAL